MLSRKTSHIYILYVFGIVYNRKFSNQQQLLLCFKLKYLTRTCKSLLLTYLCVGSHVKSDGQTLVGLDARQSCVEREFTHWNAHSVSTQVSQTQNTLPISHNNSSNIWLRPAILPGSNVQVDWFSNVYNLTFQYKVYVPKYTQRSHKVY